MGIGVGDGGDLCLILCGVAMRWRGGEGRTWGFEGLGIGDGMGWVVL